MINNPLEIAMKITFREFNDSINNLAFNNDFARIEFVNGYVLQISIEDGELYYEFENVYKKEELTELKDD